jgi:hypothetical protein
MPSPKPPSQRPDPTPTTTPLDPAAALSHALDRLNACCWTAEDRRALRDARAACARLRELEGIHKSFPDQIRAFWMAGMAADDRRYMGMDDGEPPTNA